MSLCMGIDPGSPGAFAFVSRDNPKDTYMVYDFPTNLAKLMELLTPFGSMDIAAVCIEKVNSFGMGRTSAFNFGRNVGTWEGILLAGGLWDKVQYVDSKVWQEKFLMEDYLEKEYLVPADEQDKKKRRSRRRQELKKMSRNQAKAYFKDAPIELVKHSDRADALWIAMYARDRLIV